MSPAPHEHAHSLNTRMARAERDSGDHFAAAISDGAKKTAIAIFEALGAAEAKIHNIDIEACALS